MSCGVSGAQSPLDLWLAAKECEGERVVELLQEAALSGQDGTVEEHRGGDDHWRVAMREGGERWVRAVNLELLPENMRLCVGARVRVHGRVRLDWMPPDSGLHTLCYKNRPLVCPPLLAAIGGTDRPPDDANTSRQRCAVVRALLEARADVHAVGKVHNAGREIHAVHLAAAAGNADVMQMIVDFGADIEAKALVDGAYHFLPIHDAVWLNRLDVVKLLLKLCAKTGAPNNRGMTALHFAARLGHDDVAARLLLHDEGATLQKLDGEGNSALDLALQSSKFNPKKLYIFTQHLDSRGAADAFKKVAAVCPAVAPALVREQNHDQTHTVVGIEPRWRRNLQQAAALGNLGVRDLVKLLKDAPLSAIDLLEVLTETPEVQDSGHEPLPIRAKISHIGDAYRMNCVYVPQKTWDWDAAQIHWHRQLAPFDQKHSEQVRVRVVLLPGLVSLELMEALSEVPDRLVFTQVALHGAVWYTWQTVRWVHAVELSVQFCSMICMVLWLFDGWSDSVLRISWCVVTSEALNECLLCTWTTWKCAALLGLEPCRKRLWRTWPRLVLAASSMAVAATSIENARPEGEWGPPLFAISALLHWVTLLWELRPFEVMGRRLLPMMKSLLLLSGMFGILGFVSVAFCHALWALQADGSHQDVGGFPEFSDIMILLLTGEASEPMEAVDGNDPINIAMSLLPIIGVVVFLVMVLNMFIAVLGESYDLEQESVDCTLLEERAHFCCGFFLAPGIELTVPQRLEDYMASRKAGVGVLSGVGAWLVAWAFIVFLLRSGLPVEIPAIVTALTVWASHSLLRGRLTQGWEDGYLWVCQDRSFEAETFAPDRCLGGSEESGRIIHLKKHIHDSCKATWQSISGDSWHLNKRVLKGSHELVDHQRQMRFLLSEVKAINRSAVSAGEAVAAEDVSASDGTAKSIGVDDAVAVSKAMVSAATSEAARAEVADVRIGLQAIRKDMVEQREVQTELQRTARELADTLQAIRDAQQRHALRKAGRHESGTNPPMTADFHAQAAAAPPPQEAERCPQRSSLAEIAADVPVPLPIPSDAPPAEMQV